MSPKGLLTLQNQLILPLIPLMVDTGARVLILRNKLEWFQILDLVTLLSTFSFFCLGVMSNVRDTSISTDTETNLNNEIARQKLLFTSLVSISFAGLVSIFRAIDEMYPSINLYKEQGFYLFILCLIFVIYNFLLIYFKLISYVNKGI